MACLDGPHYGKARISGDTVNNRTYVVPFTLQVDQYESSQQALTYLAFNYNPGSNYYISNPSAGTDDDGYEENQGAIISDFSIDPIDDTGWFSGTITFTTSNPAFVEQVESLTEWNSPTTPTSQNTTPEERKPTLSRSTEYMEIAWTHDMVSGEPIKNSSEQPTVGMTRRCRIGVYTLQWFEANLSKVAQYESFINTINSATFQGKPAAAWLLDDMTWTPDHNNGSTTYNMTMVFKHLTYWVFARDDVGEAAAWIDPGWLEYIQDRGTRVHGAGLTWKVAKNENTGELEEWLLDGAGHKLTDGADPVYRVYSKYRAKDFGTIFS